MSRRAAANLHEQFDRFTPKLPAAHWQVIRPFVLESAAAVHPRLGSDANRTLSFTARFVHWVWQSAGHELTSEIFTSAMIEVYLGRALKSRSGETLRAIRCTLNQIGAALGHTDMTLLRAKGSVKTTSRAFSDRELEMLRAWAGSQTTFERRRSASVLVALVGGGGLRVQELQTLMVQDIRIDAARAVVTIRGNWPRTVELDEGWAHLLRIALSTLGPESLVFRSARTSMTNRGLVTSFLQTCSRPPIPFSARDLRSAWMLRHPTT